MVSHVHSTWPTDKIERVGTFAGNRVVLTVWFPSQPGCGQTDNIQVPDIQADGVSHEDCFDVTRPSWLQVDIGIMLLLRMGGGGLNLANCG